MDVCGYYSLMLFMVFTLDVNNNFEEDGYADDTSEMIVQYIIDQLITSVTASAGMCLSQHFYFPLLFRYHVVFAEHSVYF